jgi:hypothetical protein
VSRLTWTSERPTVPGWYWTLGRSGIPAVVYVERAHRGQLLEVNGRYVADLNRHWAGPLPMPEAP